jgi:RimJ/RimL family protein N-acetyltransferase
MGLLEAPSLTTQRLLLRSLSEDDFEAFAEMASDEEVMRYIGGVVDRPQAWRQMAMHVGHWGIRGYGNWGVERQADSKFIGRVGFWNPESWPGLELGWKLARDSWGSGFATEAAERALQWAWDALPVEHVISCVHPDNVASANVARRLGMQAVDEMLLNGSPATIFSIDKPK